jgi:hypothetical protein
MNFTRMLHASFAIMKLFFHRVSIIFNTLLSVLSKTEAIYQCCKIPCLSFGAHHEWYKEILNKLQQCICRVHPNRNMNDILCLHDNAQPHNSLCRCEANANTRWTVLPHPARSKVLAPCDYNLFDPIRDALHRQHFADDNKLKQFL